MQKARKTVLASKQRAKAKKQLNKQRFGL